MDKLRVTSGILLLALAIDSTSAMAGTASTELTVSVQVVARTILVFDREPARLSITQTDLDRGWITVPAGLQFRVRSNARQGYRLRFEALPEPFRRAEIRWGASSVQLTTAHEAWIAQPPVVGPGMTVTADVRLELAPDAQAGTYEWPLTLEAESI